MNLIAGRIPQTFRLGVSLIGSPMYNVVGKRKCEDFYPHACKREECEKEGIRPLRTQDGGHFHYNVIYISRSKEKVGNFKIDIWTQSFFRWEDENQKAVYYNKQEALKMLSSLEVESGYIDFDPIVVTAKKIRELYSTFKHLVPDETGLSIELEKIRNGDKGIPVEIVKEYAYDDLTFLQMAFSAFINNMKLNGDPKTIVGEFLSRLMGKKCVGIDPQNVGHKVVCLGVEQRFVYDRIICGLNIISLFLNSKPNQIFSGPIGIQTKE